MHFLQVEEYHKAGKNAIYSFDDTGEHGPNLLSLSRISYLGPVL